MREIKRPAPGEVPLEPIMVDGGYQLNILLPHRERVPRGWHQLTEDLMRGQALCEDGLRLWVRAKRLGQLQYILKRAQSFTWGNEISSNFFVRYFVQTAFYAVDRPLDQIEEESSSDVLPLTKALGFVPTDELVAEAKQLDEARREVERALWEASHQRMLKTGKRPTADEVEHFKLRGEWPEALPSAPEHRALTEGGNE